MYSSTLSLTSAVDGSGWSTPRPSRFIPRKRDIVEAAEGVAVCLNGYGKSRVQTPHRRTCSNFLYRLSYPGRYCTGGRIIMQAYIRQRAQKAIAVYVRMVASLLKSANDNRVGK
jgi:hypothetical protein